MKKKILIVDDAAIIRQQLRQCLEQGGFEVVEADSGEAGLARAQHGPHDLIISDVNMPGLNGLEMLGRIRALPAYAKTPVFMLTTESSKEMAQRGKQVGATVWIVKPFNRDVLVGGIRKLLGS